jgi:hypothetical protein
MLRKLLMVALVMVLLSNFPLLAQDRSVIWQVWNVYIDNVDTVNNRFDVTEFYNVDFSGTFRFGSRVIPFDRLDAIENVHIYQDDQLLRESCDGNAGTYCIEKTNDETSITYNFLQPITSESATFSLHYTVVGALRIYNWSDQLAWYAIPPEHFGFRIEQSVVTVELPPGFAPLNGEEAVMTYGVPTAIEVDGTSITATATRAIRGNESLEIYVQYPHDPSARSSAWQASYTKSAYDALVAAILDSLTGLFAH